MTLKDTDFIISQIELFKFTSEDNEDWKLYNLGIERAIEVIKNAPVVDAKVKIDKKEYQRDYYKRVTKLKRAKEREDKTNGLR